MPSTDLEPLSLGAVPVSTAAVASLQDGVHQPVGEAMSVYQNSKVITTSCIRYMRP